MKTLRKFYVFFLTFSYSNFGACKTVPNLMGCTTDNIICSPLNLLLCFVLNVLSICTLGNLFTNHDSIVNFLSFMPAVCKVMSLIAISFEKEFTDFKLISLNVLGIRSPKKRKALLMWLKERKCDIIFLQETYSTDEVEDIWRTQWQGELFFSHGTNHSCGVMILVRNDLEFNLKTIQVDNEGRYITMEAEVQSSNFLFVNIYAPNKVQEQCQFFDKLNKTIEDLVVNDEHKIVIGGDFNVAQKY